MSGIVGIWNLDGQPVARDVLARLSAMLAHRGPDGEGLWIGGAAGVACQLMRVTPESAAESQPYVHESGVVLVFDGRLDNRGELLLALATTAGMGPDVPDARLVVAAYHAYGEEFPKHLNGDFALGLFDPGRQRLLLARDAIGIRPLYHCRAGSTFLFASEIKALLAHPRVTTQPNEDALANIILGPGYSPDDLASTCFEGVFRLPPAHVLCVTAGQVVTRRYWDFDLAARARIRSFPECVEAFRVHFEEAVRRRIRSAFPVVVSVSGGLDSSAIFCAGETLRKREGGQQQPLVGMSYIYAEGLPSDEKAFLLDIERDYGVSIARIPAPATGFLAGARDQVWQGEAPFLDTNSNGTPEFFGHATATGARVMLTGHWGDQMLVEQAYLVDLFRSLAWGEVREHLAKFQWWCPDVDLRHFQRRFLNDVVRRYLPGTLLILLRQLRDVAGAGAAERMGYTKAFRRRRREGLPKAMRNGVEASAHAAALYSMVRSNYHVLCMESQNKLAAAYGVEMRFPFLDRDLIAFLLSIPGEMQTWKGTHKALLRYGMSGILPASIAGRRGKADFTEVSNDGLKREWPQLLDAMANLDMAARWGYVRGDLARKRFEALRAGLERDDAVTGWNIGDTLGLEFFLQIFFSQSPSVQSRPIH